MKYKSHYMVPLAAVLTSDALKGNRLTVYRHLAQWGRNPIPTKDLEAIYKISPTIWQETITELVTDGWLLKKATDPEGNDLVENPIKNDTWLHPNGDPAEAEIHWYEVTVPPAIREATKPSLAILDRWSKIAHENARWMFDDEVTEAQVKDHLADVIDHIPEVYGNLADEGVSLMKRWPSLFDWQDPEVAILWAEKAIKAMSTQGHPLMKVIEPTLRLQIAIVLVANGLSGSDEADTVDDPISFMVDTFKYRVGRDPDYSASDLIEFAQMVEDKMSKLVGANVKTLRGRAKDYLAGEHHEAAAQDTHKVESELVETNPVDELVEAAAGPDEPIIEAEDDEPWASILAEMAA